jgi:nucleoid-associated protein YgaU
MLEQYRKDNSTQEQDLLPSNEEHGRRKLLFILTGAAFVIVFILFLMGMFRSEDDSLAKEPKNEAISKENFQTLEEKLATLTARVEKLEQGSISQQAPTTSSEVAPSIAVDTPALATPQEAVAMTHGALKTMITKQVDEMQKAIDTATAKKEAANKVVKTTSRAKARRAKMNISLSKDGSTYVVQKGDTLSKISQRCFGTPNRWKVIYDANKDRIANINNLKVGTALVIPQEAKQ